MVVSRCSLDGPAAPGPTPFASLDWSTLAELCWQSSAKRRRLAHLAAGTSGCGTRVAPYSATDPTAAGVDPRCAKDGCFDAFHQLLVEAREKLSQLDREGTARPNDVIRYASRVLSRMQSDAARDRRVRMGFPAKPGRSDGAAARVIAALRTDSPDPTRAKWLETLFRFLRCYAHTEGRRVACWPVDGLASEKCAIDHRPRDIGSVATREEIDADIRTVLGTAERAVGARWVHTMIWHPMLTGVVPSELADEDRLAAGGDLERQVLSAWAHREYLRARATGLSPRDAFVAAGQIVSGKTPELPDPGVLAALRELDEDLPDGIRRGLLRPD